MPVSLADVPRVNDTHVISRACAELVEVSSEESLRHFSSTVIEILPYVQDDISESFRLTEPIETS